MLRYESGTWQFIPVSNEHEASAILSALEDTKNKFQCSKDHLLGAAKFLNNKSYLDAIRESISAVEAAAKIVLSNSSITLGDAVKKLGELKQFHPAILAAMSNLYGFASDGSGIRHARKSGENLQEDDRAFAQLFFGICSSLVSYLTSN